MEWLNDRPYAAIVHPDEALLDLVQFELERAGIVTSTFVLSGEDGAATIASYLRPSPDVCVVGVASPFREGTQLLVELRASLPRTRLVALTSAPWVVGHWANGLVEECVPEGSELEQSVAATVEFVRHMLKPEIPIRDARFALRRAREAIHQSIIARERSIRLRAEARDLRLAVLPPPDRTSAFQFRLTGSPAPLGY